MNFSASGSTKKGVLYFSKPFYTVSNEVQINNLQVTKKGKVMVKAKDKAKDK